MVVSSILQHYFHDLKDTFQDTGLQIVIKHKWNILAGTVATYAIYKYLHRPRNLPPGPCGLPLIGSPLELSENIHLDYLRLSKQYNSDIISFYLGKRLSVILNSAEAVKMAFGKSDIIAHRDSGMAVEFNMHEEFLTKSYTEEWKKLKSFTMSSLKTHGLGTVKSEDNMKLQLSRMINHIDSLPDNTIESEQLKELMSKAAACVIMKILANDDYEFDDPKLEDLMNAALRFMMALLEFVVNPYLHILPRTLLWLLRWKFARDGQHAMQHVRDLLMTKFQQHKLDLDVNNPQDFMDDILIWNCGYTDLQLVDTILILVPDAIDTMGAQSRWVLFYICWFQDVQEKMLKEIKSVCGDTMPGFKDRNNLPYCEAVLVESLRLSSVAVTTMAHVNQEDTQVKSYFIPKNTLVTANLYGVHYDERVFPKPNQFKPDRFISAEGKLTNLENVMPFGAGRRKCIGEALTKSQIFFYATGLVQNYHITFPEDGKPDSFGYDDVYRIPAPHKMKFTPRY